MAYVRSIAVIGTDSTIGESGSTPIGAVSEGMNPSLFPPQIRINIRKDRTL